MNKNNSDRESNSVINLPFVENAPGRRLPTRNFWSVEPTDNYEADCKTGAEYAEQAIQYARKVGGGIINFAVLDMPDREEFSRLSK